MSLISHLPYSEKKINDFKFLGKMKVLLTMVTIVRAVLRLQLCFNSYSCTPQTAEQKFHKLQLILDNTIYRQLYVYKNLSQFNER